MFEDALQQSKEMVNIGRGIVVTTPAPRRIWEEVLQEDQNSLVDQSPAWLDAMCSTGNFKDASRLYEWDGNRLVLPLVRGRGLPSGFNMYASNPGGWGIGGPVSSRPLEVEDIRMVLDDLTSAPGLRKVIRPNPLDGEQWKAASDGIRLLALPRVAHVLNLEGGFQQVWLKKFDSLTRRNIRKAEKSDLVVECDTTGKLVPVFYDLFMQSIDRWAGHQNEPRLLARWRVKLRDPRSKFERMARILGNRAHIWVAWSGGQPAAALLVLQGKNAHYTRGAMDRDLAGPTRANDLLHRLAIEEACQSGCRYYHMGETGQSESLARFKSRFGAQPYEYAEYVLERMPFTRMDISARNFIKRLIGFKDVRTF